MLHQPAIRRHPFRVPPKECSRKLILQGPSRSVLEPPLPPSDDAPRYQMTRGWGTPDASHTSTASSPTVASTRALAGVTAGGSVVGGERPGAWDQPANSPGQGSSFPQQGQGHGDREGPCLPLHPHQPGTVTPEGSSHAGFYNASYPGHQIQASHSGDQTPLLFLIKLAIKAEIQQGP